MCVRVRLVDKYKGQYGELSPERLHLFKAQPEVVKGLITS